MGEITEQIYRLKDKIIRGRKLDWREENTKMAIISKVLQILGYDTTEPDEVDWESSIKIDGNSGEKVDFAIYLGGEKPEFIIEAKAINVYLANDKLWNQLFTYYNAMQPSVAILTNGDDWWFYTDRVKKNILDREPYLKLNISHNKKETLSKFEDYAKDNIKSLDLMSKIMTGTFHNALDELFCKLKLGYFPDYLVNAFIESYKLDLDYEQVKQEIEYRFKSEVLGEGRQLGLNELSPIYKARATKFEEMTHIALLYSQTDLDNKYLRDVYLYDTYTKVSSWEDLFKQFVLLSLEKGYDNLELFCDLDIWTNGIYIKRGKTADNRFYYPNYDITIKVSGTKRVIVKKLIEMTEALGLGYSIISFDTEVVD